MGTLTNLNPSFYKTIVQSAKNGRQQQVIYSTLENFSINQSKIDGVWPVDGTKDLLIYAKNLKILESIKIPRGSIKIIAKKITLASDISLDITPEPFLDVKIETTNAKPYTQGERKPNVWENWKNNPMILYNEDYPPIEKIQYGERIGNYSTSEWKGKNGRDGHKGNKAGEIYLLVEQLESNGNKLTLNATGGIGGNGEGGMHGPVGVNGEDGIAWVPSTWKWGKSKGIMDLRLMLSNLYEHWAQRGSDGGQGGDAGKGGNGGQGGTISLICTEKDRSYIETIVTGGQPGTDGEFGKKTEPTKGGKLDIYYGSIKPENLRMTLQMRPGVASTDGKPVVRAKDEGLGKEGKLNFQTISKKLQAENFDSTFLLKMLQRAKNSFLYEPPYQIPKEERYNSETWQILDWLYITLKGIVTKKNKKAEEERKLEIYTEAHVLRGHYHFGKSMYGKQENWAPSLSLEIYTDLLKDQITTFASIEKQFNDDLKFTTDKEQNTIKLKELESQLNAKKRILEKKENAIRKEIPIITIAIGDFSKFFNNTKSAIRSTIKGYENQLSNYIDCDITKILKALEMVAFDPENMAMAGVQGLSLLNSSMNQINGVNKDLILDQIDQLDDELSGKPQENALSEKLREMSKDIPELDDPNKNYKISKLLIVKLETFEKEIEKVKKALDDNGAKLKTLIPQLKTVIEKKNEALIEYNTIFSMILQFKTQLKTIESKIENINSQFAKDSDPTEIGTISYLAVLYQNMRDHVMETLYKAEQAYKFLKGSSDIPGTGFSYYRNKVLWTDGEAPTQFSASDLEDALASIQNEVVNAAEAWGSNAQQEPNKKDTPSDIKVVINDKTFLESFILSGKPKESIPEIPVSRFYHFTIVTSHEESTQTNAHKVYDTKGKYDIRVNFVRPRLVFHDPHSDHGSDKVEFEVVHSGSSTIYVRPEMLNPDDPKAKQSIKFKHEPNTKTTKQLIKLIDGKDYESGTDGKYKIKKDDWFAPIGIFSEWSFTIDMDLEVNKGLILDDLKQIEIEFGCSFHQ